MDVGLREFEQHDSECNLMLISTSKFFKYNKMDVSEDKV